MADTFNALIERYAADGGAPEPYARATALFYYHGGYQSITKAVKYGGNDPLGIWFGRLLGEKLRLAGFYGQGRAAVGDLPPVTAVVPVPIHWKRRWKRGYNQAELIARGVAETIGAPLRTDILRRVRPTVSQTTLTRQERLGNVFEAFRASPQITTGHILLIDDVFTTGSTLFSARRALLEAAGNPAPLISIATLACV